MTQPFNVLVSSAGRRVALLDIIRRSLRDLDLPGVVIAADTSALAPGLHFADVGVQVPRCTSPAFLPELLAICRQHDVRLVIPTIDTELAVLSAGREQFQEVGCTIAVSGPETVAIGTDKRLTHSWLEGRRLPTVRQAEATEVLRQPDHWKLPLVLKPQAGSASIGVRVVQDRDELAFAARDPELIAQQLAPGDEYTIDVLVDRNRRAVCAVPRRRVEVRAGEVSKGITVRDPLLEQIACDVAETLPDAYGALNIQVFLDRDEQQPRVIEINPRFGGGFPLSDRAGAPFVRWIIEEAAGLPSSASPGAWQSGVVMLRYDDAVFVDAAEVGIDP